MKHTILKSTILAVFVCLSVLPVFSQQNNQNQLIVVLPLRYLGTDPLTSDGDLRDLGGEAVQLELIHKGYPATFDEKSAAIVDTLTVNWDSPAERDIQKIGKSLEADLIICGDISILPVNHVQDKVVIHLIALNTKDKTLAAKETYSVRIMRQMDWRELLHKVGRNFVLTLETRGLI